jgi:hypothetical protein
MTSTRTYRFNVSIKLKSKYWYMRDICVLQSDIDVSNASSCIPLDPISWIVQPIEFWVDWVFFIMARQTGIQTPPLLNTATRLIHATETKEMRSWKTYFLG